MIRSFITISLVWFLMIHSTLSQLPSSCENPLQVCELDTIHLTSHLVTTEINDIVNEVCGIEDMAISSMYKGANWLRYKFVSAGDFRFTLYPNSMHTDLDFYVFSSKGDCNSLTNIRCMLSGSSDNPRCMGTTGLSDVSMDTYEYAGCDYFDDNYVASINVSPGDILYLAIYNFSENDTDYRIVHDGSARLTCDTNSPRASAKIYPNPSAGKLKITGYNLQSSSVGIEIYGNNGQVHLRRSVNLDEIIDISELPSGVFILKIHQDGQLIKSQRIINVK